MKKKISITVDYPDEQLLRSKIMRMLGEEKWYHLQALCRLDFDHDQHWHECELINEMRNSLIIEDVA